MAATSHVAGYSDEEKGTVRVASLHSASLVGYDGTHRDFVIIFRCLIE